MTIETIQHVTIKCNACGFAIEYAPNPSPALKEWIGLSIMFPSQMERHYCGTCKTTTKISDIK